MKHARAIATSSLIAVAALVGSSASAALVATDLVVLPVTVTGLVEGAPLSSGAVATFVDLNSPGSIADYTAAIHWGDGTTSAGTILFVSTGRYRVTGSHTYAEEGAYAYSTDVTYSPRGFTAVGLVTSANVSDAPLDLVSSQAGTYRPGVLLSNAILATFRDENPFPSITDFTATINWGDGTPLTFGTIIAVSGGYSVEGSHTYATGGSHPVVVAIQDDGGSSLGVQTVESSIPEPATVSLFGLGAAAVALARRTRPAPRA